MSRQRRDDVLPAPARRNRPLAEAGDALAFFDHGGTAYFGYRMALAAKLFDRSIARILADNGELTLPEWRALSQLGLRGDASVRTLADGAAVDRAEAEPGGQRPRRPRTGRAA